MNNLRLIFIGFVLSAIFYFAIRRWRYNAEVTLDEIRYRMVPVDRDLLLEIEQDSGVWLTEHKDYGVRRELRSALDDIKEQFHRISVNSTRIRDCARYYHSLTERQLSEEQFVEQEPETVQELHSRSKAIERALAATADLRSILRRGSFVIWIGDMSAFNKRSWGPVPDLAKMRIPKVLEAYDRVKMAAVHLAQAYGEGVISQQLAEQM